MFKASLPLLATFALALAAQPARAAAPDEATAKAAASDFLKAVAAKKADALRAAVGLPYWQQTLGILPKCTKLLAAKNDKAFAAASKCLLGSIELVRLIGKNPLATLQYAATVAALPADDELVKKHKKKLAAKEHAFVRVVLGDYDKDGEDFTLVLAIGPDGKVHAVIGQFEVLGG